MISAHEIQSSELAEPPSLSVVIVHWRDENALARLLESADESPEVEWLVIDNSGTGQRPDSDRIRWIAPPRNLGFGGGVNLGISCARGGSILVLNPDARPRPGALQALIAADRAQPLDSAGLVPKLVDTDGAAQWPWQLRDLPSPWQLLLQAFFIDRMKRPDREPIAGQPIEQPAAAALLLRRSALESIAGFDPRYQPAWFEDVDLGARLKALGFPLLYCPQAEFTHGQGGSVAPLGYDRFLAAYYRNLGRYMRQHARPWSWLLPPCLALGMSLRLLFLPLRKPRRAATRAVAARGLLGVIAGALGSPRSSDRWRRPR